MDSILPKVEHPEQSQQAPGLVSPVQSIHHYNEVPPSRMNTLPPVGSAVLVSHSPAGMYSSLVGDPVRMDFAPSVAAGSADSVRSENIHISSDNISSLLLSDSFWDAPTVAADPADLVGLVRSEDIDIDYICQFFTPDGSRASTSSNSGNTPDGSWASTPSNSGNNYDASGDDDFPIISLTLPRTEEVVWHQGAGYIFDEQPSVETFSYAGGIYRGKVNCNGVPHGLGYLIYNSDVYYYGNWCNGVEHGFGLIVWANGTFCIDLFNFGRKCFQTNVMSLATTNHCSVIRGIHKWPSSWFNFVSL